MQSTAKINHTFELLKIFGIIYILFSHFYEPKIFYYPACSCHVAIFFFVSGYTFNLRQQTLLGRLKYIIGCTMKFLPSYFCYQAFYTIMVQLIGSVVYQGEHVPSVFQSTSFSLYELFVESLIHGSTNRFFADACLIPHLWMTQCVFVLIYINPWHSRILDVFYLLFFLVVNIVVTYWSGIAFGKPSTKLVEQMWHESLQSDSTIYNVSCFLLIKIGFTLVLLFLGLFYRQHVETTHFGKKHLFTIYGFILAYIIMNYFWNIYGNAMFFFVNKIGFATAVLPCYVPIITILLGIYIYTFLSRAAQSTIDENSLIYRISEKSYTILCQHTFYFFIINLCIAKFVFGTKLALNQVDTHSIPMFRPDLIWPLYMGVGLVLPTFVSSYSEWIMPRCFISKTSQPSTKIHQD